VQLQVLIDDSTRLQEAYPGGNAEHIASQQAMVVDNWEILQQKSAQRKSDLQATMDLYWFLNAVCYTLLVAFRTYCHAAFVLELLMVKHYILYISDNFLTNRPKDINYVLYNLCTSWC